MDLQQLLNGLHRALEGTGFDSRFVSESVIDTGVQATRARGIAAKLNAVRPGLDKDPVLLWSSDHAAVTARGRYVYVATPLAQRLSDDGLAFVIAHEMAHHDLGHVSNPVGTLAALSLGSEAELHADAAALKVMGAAGFDPKGALEALGRELWTDEPTPERPRYDPRRWIPRWRHSHPPTPERLAAIERLIAASP